MPRDNKSLWLVPIVDEQSETGRDFDAIVRKQFGDEHVFTKSDVLFFRGVEVAHERYARGVAADAKRMIAMIERHGKVRGWFA